MKASQKTGPELWFGVPRGGVKPAVGRPFLANEVTA